jgi:hypothetical protein
MSDPIAATPDQNAAKIRRKTRGFASRRGVTSSPHRQTANLGDQNWLTNQRDLAPGLFARRGGSAKKSIKDPDAAWAPRGKLQLAVVITAFTVLEPRHRPSSVKPVMEGKAVLFKKVCERRCGADIEINEKTPPSWSVKFWRWSLAQGAHQPGRHRGARLFYVERRRKRMKIRCFMTMISTAPPIHRAPPF